MTTHLEHHGAVAVITLDRPERRNALDRTTLEELLAIQSELATAACRAVVLTGAPPAFSAGADLEGVESGEFVAMLGAVLAGFTQLRAPVVAAIDGPALGAGTQLAVACDLRVATASSVFGIPAAKLGLVVDRWTVARLGRELGWPTARLMLLAAETCTGEQLAALGAVHRLGGLDVAMSWAARLAELAPLTISTHKLTIERAAARHDDDVDELVEAARAAAWASDDAEEGRLAFLEKRRPRFTGR